MATNTIHTTTASTVAARPAIGASTNRRRTEVRLWVTQGALAALFLFAGAGKLAMPAEELTRDSAFSAEFLRLIGTCEVLGAVGLILPWLIRVKPVLTPLAAAGLVVIMVGATVTVAVTMSPALALLDVAVGAAAFSVVAGRRDYATRSR